MRLWRLPLAAVLTAWMSFNGPHVQATTVQSISFDGLCEQAGFVFHGRVVDVFPRQDSNGRIWTRVRFEVIEVLKGETTVPALELDFLGGRIGELELTVAHMRVPAPLEEGVYFVEAPGRRQANPLLGWRQGHYVVTAGEDGERRVASATGADLVAIAPVPEPTRDGFSSGVARGLIVRSQAFDPAAVDGEPGLALDAFLEAVRARVE